jgi:hypothetical protein
MRAWELVLTVQIQSARSRMYIITSYAIVPQPVCVLFDMVAWIQASAWVSARVRVRVCDRVRLCHAFHCNRCYPRHPSES